MAIEEISFHDCSRSILIGDFHSFFHRTFWELFEPIFFVGKSYFRQYREKRLNYFCFFIFVGKKWG